MKSLIPSSLWEGKKLGINRDTGEDGYCCIACKTDGVRSIALACESPQTPQVSTLNWEERLY